VAAALLAACTRSRTDEAAPSSKPAAPPIDKLPEDPAAGERAVEQWRAHLREEERERRANYDRARLPEHRALIELLEEARKSYDGARTEAELKSVQARFHAGLPKLRARIEKIDPWGNSSHVLTDYTELIELFDDSYPRGRSKALSGDAGALERVRSSADARFKTIEDWLRYASTAEEE